MTKPLYRTIQKSGLSLIEYSLISALVLAVSVSGLVLVGNNTNVLFSNLLKEVQGHSVAVAKAESTGMPSAQQASVAKQDATTSSEVSSETEKPSATGSTQADMATVCFDKQCLQVPEIKSGTVATVNGALGGELTASFADVIQQIADAIQQDPNADPSLVNLITALAKQGHGIAGTQRDLMAKCPTQACMGQLKEATLLGMATNQEASDVDTLVGNVGKANTTFKATLTTLQNYLLKNPSSLPLHYSNLITQESNQIITIAGSIQLNQEAIPDGIFTNTQTKGWDTNDAAVLTEQSANTICQSGGDTSRCVVLDNQGT